MTATPEQQTAPETALRRVSNGGVIVVERKQPSQSYGQGIAKGMGVIIRHFAKSFTTRIDDKSDQAGMFTVEYPEERMELPEAFRNMPILLYDDKTGQELCTSCFQCERICPPKVIHITQAKDPKTGKPVPAAEEFIIEYDSCMSCGLCHEVCPFDAIKMDHFFELSTHDHLAMEQNKAALNRPISYYQAIAPNLWAAVEANAIKKLQNNIKRRPGNIGVAPHMIGKAQQALPAAGAARAATSAAARPTTPVAAIGKNMPPEKVERLKAIRAANAAKLGGEMPSPEQTLLASSAYTTATASPESGLHTAESQAGLGPSSATTPAPHTGPVAAAGQNMSDEKKARLEAIRAAKRAQRGEQ